jgi:hypothetical protein
MAVTLHKYLSKLTPTDKALICASMRAWGGFPDCHNGLLPFLKMEGIISALTMSFDSSLRKRPYASLLEKLQAHLHRNPGIEPGLYGLVLTLDDRKVWRKFGLNPNKPTPRTGIIIPGAKTIQRTAGVSYNIGKRDYTPHFVDVPLEVKLSRAGKDLWVLYTKTEGREKAAVYLLDHCGLTQP